MKLSDEDEEMVSLAGFKAWARKCRDSLPADSRLCTLLEQEPDRMPRAEALNKLDVYRNLLREELARRRQ